MVTNVCCPACVELGYPVPRLCFRVIGEMTKPDAPVLIQFHCKRCKSDVQWRYSTVEFEIVKLGERNHHQQKASFE